jgi:rfaE bifunctional protein nucleotidyltransferase chain/domain
MVKAAKKIVPASRLAAQIARRRAKGEKVVFTNGVFDLLHAGHVTLLEKARALGDCLVVGINSDASVRRLKGRGRPLASLTDRRKVLAALESVDFVTDFGEDTPQQLIRKLKPTILVKGGDYSLDQIVGRNLVARVVRVPFVKGRSTSALVRKILKAYGRS